jgi:hypothetical protein
MKLTETWQAVARRQTKNAEWMWSLDALERIMLTKMVDEGKADIKLDRKSGGRQEMLARDRWLAMRTRATVDEPPASVESPAVVAPATAEKAVTVPARRVQFPIIYLPPAKPIGARTYVPYFGDVARWVERPEPRLRGR